MSIQLLPTSLLYQIIQSVPFPDRWETLLVCKSWYDICTDPYLYQEINLESLELNMLVKALHWIEKRRGAKNPTLSVRSLNIRHCYSDFLAKTIVPVTANRTLYSQLRTLTPHRRQQEYIKHDFRLYDDLSGTLTRLLTEKLIRVEITHCDLDWAMTNLFTMLITFGAGRHLTTWIYHDNYTNDGSTTMTTGCTMHKCPPTSSTPSPTDHHLLQAFIKACPDMKHFMGHHGAVNDTILMTMARSWPRLESLVLPAASSSSSISAKSFYSFLSQCSSLHTLVLEDLACMHQDNLIQMCHWRQQRQRHQRRHHHQPYRKKHHDTIKRPVGGTLRHVKFTKYITTPLSAQAMLPLLTLFPHLESLTYETNHTCFDMAYLSSPEKDLQWQALVQWQQQQQEQSSAYHCDFIIRLTCSPTMEQLLLHTSRQVMMMTNDNDDDVVVTKKKH